MKVGAARGSCNHSVRLGETKECSNIGQGARLEVVEVSENETENSVGSGWLYCGSEEVMGALKKRGWTRDNNWRKMRIENASVKKIPDTELYALYGKLKMRSYRVSP